MEIEEKEFAPNAVQNNDWSQDICGRSGKKREGSAVT